MFGGRDWKLDPLRLIPPLLFGGLATGYLMMSGGFADPVSAQAPQLYGKILLALCAVIFAVELFASFRGKSLARKHNDEIDARRASALYLGIAGLVAMIFAFGFFAAVGVFLFLFFRFVAHLKLPLSLAAAALFVLFVWLVFAEFLGMRVFAGFLLPKFGL